MKTKHLVLIQNVYNFVKNSVIEKEIEYPQTGGGSNYYVRYYPIPNL